MMAGCDNNKMPFDSKWVKPQGESVGHKLLEGIKPQAPLKPRIEEAQKKLHMQIARLDAISSRDRKSTRLNSSHANISYAVFCLKKKNAVDQRTLQYPPPIGPCERRSAPPATPTTRCAEHLMHRSASNPCPADSLRNALVQPC